MAVKTIKCPACGEEIQVNTEKEVNFCQNCGKRLIRKQKIESVSSITSISTDNEIAGEKNEIEKLFIRAEDMIAQGNHQAALDYYNKILDIDINNEEARTKALQLSRKIQGKPLDLSIFNDSASKRTQTYSQTTGVYCPKCGSNNVDIQMHQENTGSTTVSHTKTKFKAKATEKKHGCLWWIFIGSWWWLIDLIIWITLFVPRLLIQIFKKKKYKIKGNAKSTTAAHTKNHIQYKSIALCKSCGYHWKV